MAPSPASLCRARLCPPPRLSCLGPTTTARRAPDLTSIGLAGHCLAVLGAQLSRPFVPRPLPLSTLPATFAVSWLFELDSMWCLQAFVEFADENSCAAGKAAIHGRLFAGETVRATFVTPEYFSQLG